MNDTVATRFFSFGSEADPFRLYGGGVLSEVTLAYETYGELSEAADNAVLVFHALTGSQHVSGFNPNVPGLIVSWNDECRTGWWDAFVGRGRAIDTDRFFVIAANYLGGCYGSTGPGSVDAQTGRPYGSSFPSVGFCDMVDAQVRLLEHLGVERLHAAIGGSTGGVMAISLATRYPDLVDIVIPVAAGARVSALQLIHNFEQIVAIENDPAFHGGDYYERPPGPRDGLTLARMIGHKTFVSLEAMEARARSEVLGSERAGEYRIGSPIESYMWHQGRKFVERFDANSYLRIIEAWQTFDLAAEAGAGDLFELFTNAKGQRYMLFSIDSDVCFYPDEQAELAAYLRANDVQHRHITVHSDRGHDSFLLEPRLYAPHLMDTLNNPWI
jgi:homoserine O-acetyltransferase/O-succinyltransferase